MHHELTNNDSTIGPISTLNNPFDNGGLCIVYSDVRLAVLKADKWNVISQCPKCEQRHGDDNDGNDTMRRTVGSVRSEKYREQHQRNETFIERLVLSRIDSRRIPVEADALL